MLAEPNVDINSGGNLTLSKHSTSQVEMGSLTMALLATIRTRIQYKVHVMSFTNIVSELSLMHHNNTDFYSRDCLSYSVSC